MKTDRRSFIKNSSYLAIGFAGLRQYVHANTSAAGGQMATVSGYGPLLPDPKKILDLPKGFSYQVIARAGEKLDDGLILPRMPDGMAAFPGEDGRVILVMNHEVSSKAPSADGPFGKGNTLLTKSLKEKAFDAGRGQPMLGGTSTLVYNPETRAVEKKWMSLLGTERNCAGGATPWNSWITCEETDGVGKSKRWEEDHGYNFEVPATSDVKLHKAVPLKGMGRFRHEAVAVDPKTTIIYQTEDLDDGIITRFIPSDPNDLTKGGQLQALTIAGEPKCDTRNWVGKPSIEPGLSYGVRWVDIKDPESIHSHVRHQGQDKGAAIFARGEGMWFSKGDVYFACTNGGKIKHGQVFKYTPSPVEGTADEANNPGVLELFVESTDSEILSNADNLTVASWGDVIIAEDTYGARFANLVGITPEGACYDIARNPYNKSELAGACFSPDFKTLFVNIQAPALTLAITGPWEQKV